MSEKNLLIVLLVLCNFQANAQQVLVCDGATRFPLRDVETLAILQFKNRSVSKPRAHNTLKIHADFLL